ncbi:uncharacterized protein BcabD6B2_52830 [Babesia caballi]|uniref:Variant erythrocyte surface antigen-1, beta subunit n=1 Tax=Babesia caballi TaxID=5871 RepID=A0AAV4M0C2_BABCB|nr:hypothetical protein, conserved [Babesia caballi]
MRTATVKSLTDCPSNMKEAVDWILCATGRDGNGGPDNTCFLAEAVQRLFSSTLSGVSQLPAYGHMSRDELNKCREGLSQAAEWLRKDLAGTYRLGPIGTLANGLAKFIGYENRGSYFSGTNNWKITGAGIAPSNIAINRLCDAAIAFTIELLRGNINSIRSRFHRSKINGVIDALYGAYGRGIDGLRCVAAQVMNINRSDRNHVEAFVNAVFEAVRKLDCRCCRGTNASTDNVATHLSQYFQTILQAGKVKSADVFTQLQKIVKCARDMYDPIALSSEILNVISTIRIQDAQNVFRSAFTAGQYSVWSQLYRRNHTPSYKPSSNLRSAFNGRTADAAKIFLSCLPLCYYGLTYLYWRCTNREWSSQKLTGDNTGYDLQWFTTGIGFNHDECSNNTGKKIMSQVAGVLKELSNAAVTKSKPYTEFLRCLWDNFRNYLNKGPTRSEISGYTVSVLLFATKTYFKLKQHQNAERAGTFPNTIRDMLYYLAALPFAPQYDGLVNYGESVISVNGLRVVDSGSPKRDHILTYDEWKTYLDTTCYHSAAVIGLLQGHSDTATKEPWLHRLYSNSEFQFTYPTAANLFYKLCDYAYALQFQLLFLFLMCNNNPSNCCWWDCRFGKGVRGDNAVSHVCGIIANCKKKGCEHNGQGTNSQCKHHDRDAPTCGSNISGGSSSPLQAFLTDALTTFYAKPSKDLKPQRHEHMVQHPAGSMCHTPMGFANHLRKDPGQGENIYDVLRSMCGDSMKPLRRLCATLICLTKRTPMTLGDLFGFYWHLASEWNEGGRSGSVKNAIKNTAEGVIGRYCDAMKGFTDAIEDLLWHCHNGSNGFKGKHITSNSNIPCKHGEYETADLFGIYDCNGGSVNNKRCGPYIYPLVYTNGTTFGKPVLFVSAYVSWIVYLTDCFHGIFFVNIAFILLVKSAPANLDIMVPPANATPSSTAAVIIL